MKVNVEFIIVGPSAQRHRDAILAERLQLEHEAGKRVALFCDDADRLRWLDRVLWTFDAASFIAHRIIDDSFEGNPRIREAYFMNDSSYIPENIDVLFVEASEEVVMDKAPQIIEVIGNKEDQVLLGRKRFGHYRDLGLTPTVNRVD